jgi:hypothetical protein
MLNLDSRRCPPELEFGEQRQHLHLSLGMAKRHRQEPRHPETLPSLVHINRM